MDTADEEQSRRARLNRAKKEKKKRAKAKRQLGDGDAAAGGEQAELTKRPQTEEELRQLRGSHARNAAAREETDENLDFEDPFEDVYEEEDIIDEGGDEEEEEGGDAEMAIEDEEDVKEQVRYYAPRKDAEEELEVDYSAYPVLNQMRFEWPALSFDFFTDHMGMERTRYPTSVWLVAGTQTDTSATNALNVIRIGNVCRTREDPEDDGMVVLEDEEEEGDPTMEHRVLEHREGTVNRVRAMPQQPGVVASWAESGKVCLYDARRSLQTLDLEIINTAGATVGASARTTPVFVMSKHKDEGYGLDWSPRKAGRLATGDVSGEIYIWEVGANGTVTIEPQPFKGHEGSVEDLQWSPTEETVLASCSTDGTVRIWDTRVKKGAMLTQKAHEQDVNVLSWNKKVAYLLATGSDDCSFKVWDLRQFSSNQQVSPVGWFKGFHTDSITSIEWSPHDESVIACASADHQTTIWDLALEEDREFARQAADKGFSEDVLDEHGRPIQFPPQLLFVHAGVRDPKEVHFHPQAIGLIGVTGDSGFDLFLCESLDPKSQAARLEM